MFHFDISICKIFNYKSEKGEFEEIQTEHGRGLGKI